MTEYCGECYVELFGDGDFILTKTFELCEGCGEYKHVVIAEKREYYAYKFRFFIIIFKIIYLIPYVLWRLLLIPYLIYKEKKKNRG